MKRMPRDLTQRELDERDRADPLYAFLGADDVALRILRALRRDERNWGRTWTEGSLRDACVSLNRFDVHGIGPMMLDRVQQKTGVRRCP